MKKKQTILCSNDENINKLISTLANKKVFNRLLEVLRSIGTFDTKIEIFKDESNLDDEKIKVWCFDQNNNIFVFCLFSDAKQDFFKISEERNDGVSVYYDFSLSKNYPLSSNNISFIKSKRYLKDEKDQVILKIGDLVHVQTHNTNHKELLVNFDFIKNISLEQQNKKGATALRKSYVKKLY